MYVFMHGILSFLICAVTPERRLLINIDMFGDRETILTRHTSHSPDVKVSPAVSKRAKTRKSILLAGNMNHLVGNDERDHDSEGYINSRCAENINPNSTRHHRSQHTLLGPVRNGEVRQIRVGVRSCFHPHLKPSYRRLVQAVHRAELLFRRESLGFAVRDPEITVCAQIWDRISAGQQRDPRRLQQRDARLQQQTNSSS